MDIFGNLVNALAEIWRNIGIAQKVSVILTGLFTVAACAAVIYYSTRPDWQVLYADMDQKTAAKVADIVTDNGVEMQLKNSGRTILVPSNMVNKLRMRVAQEGVQTGSNTSGGWEVFEGLPPGATELQQQVAKQRALQGELEKMINELPGVSSSRVMITMPQKSVYRKDKLKPSAAIVVNLKNGSGLGSQEINGIRSLVASSVPGMKPEDVTISDNRGRLLARQASSDAPGGDSSQAMELQSKTEAAFKEKAEAILRPIVGPENVVAMVTCNMDFNSIEQVIEKVDAENTVVLTEKVITEDMTKAAAGAKGPATTTAQAGAGQDGNTMVDVNNPAEPVNQQPKAATEQKKIAERTYVVPKTVQRIATKSGKVKGLTVSVTVAKRADGKSWNVKEFERLVAGAVGAALYQDFGDSAIVRKVPVVTVVETEFFKAPPAPVPTMTATFFDNLTTNYNAIGSSPLIRPLFGLLLLGGLFMVFRKYFRRGGADDTESEPQTETVAVDEVKQLPAASSEDAPQQPAEVSSLMESLQSKASTSPQTVAALLENWLSQDQQ